MWLLLFGLDCCVVCGGCQREAQEHLSTCVRAAGSVDSVWRIKTTWCQGTDANSLPSRKRYCSEETGNVLLFFLSHFSCQVMPIYFVHNCNSPFDWTSFIVIPSTLLS